MSAKKGGLNHRYPGQLVLAAAVITTVTLCVVLVLFYSSYSDATTAQVRNDKLRNLSAEIMLYDEKLTSSALLAAHTGELVWVERYRSMEPLLVSAIGKALEIARSEKIVNAASLTDDANIALVEIESKAFGHIENNQPAKAVQLLSSKTYRMQKTRYSYGMTHMINLIEKQRQQTIATQKSRLDLLLWVVPLCLAIAAALWIGVFQMLRNWGKRFAAEQQRRNDAEANVLKLNNELEQRIEQRTAELEQSQVLLLHQANHDDLTGLPNRRYVMEQLKQRLQQHDSSNRHCVIMVDLDHFKRVNDTLGHSAGDALLVEAANRLQQQVDDKDIVARLGGDEFLVVASCTADEQKISLVNGILQSFRDPFLLGNHQYDLPISPSIGVSVAPDDGTDPDALIKNADTAMYAAKDLGRNNVCLYTPRMNEQLNRRVGLETKLRAAVASKDQFHLQYQPQIDLDSNAVIGVEALLRWNQPEEGLIGPDEFIPIAEDTGIILEIGHWVLFEAARQAREWRDNNAIDLHVSINVASQQLQQSNFYDDVRCVLNEHGTDANSFGIEITERSLLGSDDTTTNTICALNKMGIAISMDDFGTGYSALSYLKRFPFEYLKIDRSFIQTILDEPTHAALVQGIINMSRNINLKVVGEGTETVEQCELLRQFGCDVAQGFYYSKPLPPADLVRFVNYHNSRQSPVLRRVS